MSTRRRSISAAELNLGDAHFAPAAIDATLASGVLKARFSNLGAYDGQANGDLIVDASAARPTFALQRRPCRRARAAAAASACRFRQARRQAAGEDSRVRSSGASQRAIMSNLDGTVFVSVPGRRHPRPQRRPDDPLADLGHAVGMAGEQGTGHRPVAARRPPSASTQGQATTTDLNLIGPLVRVTGAGTVDLGDQMLAFRVEPKLVMTTEGQGRAADPVGLGIPVMIEGPWDAAAHLPRHAPASWTIPTPPMPS